MARMVKRLSQLEIDEVSLVDRPANQHGLVAIAKNDQEDTMELYDLEGNPVDQDELEPGDRVYDADGAEYVYTETEGGGEQYDDDDDAYDDSELYAEVGKAIIPGGKLGRAGQYLRYGEAKAKQGAHRGFDASVDWAKKNKKVVGAGAGGLAAGGGAGYAFGKSFGDQVLEELSKALNEPERDAVISKAMDAVEEVSKRNAALEEAVGFLLQDRELADFTEIAKSYDGLPADEDELADILQTVSGVLSQGQLQALDRILTGASEVGKALYEEIGYGGQGDYGVLGQVYGLSEEAVIKNAQLGVSTEQAMTAIFDTNPDAYEQYLSENS